MKNRTTFIIAHRISSLKHADEILVFDKGRICEREHIKSFLKKAAIIKDLRFAIP